MRPVRAGALPALLLLLLVPAAHAAPHRPAAVRAAQPAAAPANPLRVSAVTAPRAAAPGDAVTVLGRVTNTGLVARRPRLAVELTTTDGGRLAAGGRVVAVLGGGRSGGFALRVRVPDDLEAGEYGLRVCATTAAGSVPRCASAARPLGVDGVPAPGPGFTDGARSAGDSLFPAIGNGGYDALHYDLDLAYDPAAQVLDGTATMRARATQGLRSFSLDLQGLQVESVTVGGRPAVFEREATKLVVTPPAGIRRGRTFRVAVTYGGVVEPVIDPDGSTEGFIPTDTGAVVVCEPLGAQGWFPNDNVPSDKATLDLEMTVPLGKEVIGNGVLVSRTARASTETFRWRESRPMATYLSTATIGDYRIAEATSPRGVPLYTAVDTAANGDSPAATPEQLAANQQSLLDGGEVVDFFAAAYGPYPFATSGGIIANAPEVGYQLEVQGRPVYTSNDAAALEHELAHQWFGDEATLSDWRDIWLAEGFAVWSEWLYDERHGGDTIAQHAVDVYATEVDDDPSGTWRPLIVTDPEFLFGNAPYDRGATMLEALRQQLGDRPFRRLLRDWLRRNAYGNGTTAQFVALAQSRSATDLGPFFADWLYTDGKPTTSPPAADFG